MMQKIMLEEAGIFVSLGFFRECFIWDDFIFYCLFRSSQTNFLSFFWNKYISFLTHQSIIFLENFYLMCFELMEIFCVFLIGHFPKTCLPKPISEAFIYVLACTYAKKTTHFCCFVTHYLASICVMYYFV